MAAVTIDTKAAYMVKLLRAIVGTEESLVERLRMDHEDGHYFKVFGNFDVMEIRKLRGLEEAIKSDSDYNILNLNSFPCFSLEGNESRFQQALLDAVSPSVVLLKLNNYTFKEWGLEGLIDVASKIESLDKNAIPLLGLGYYELIVLYSSNGISPVFEFLDVVRKIRLEDIFKCKKSVKDRALLVDSNTIPTVSYMNVIIPKNWILLEDKITCLFNVKCSPGHEERVASILPKSCHQFLGADDLVCKWDSPVELKRFAKFVFTFRMRAGENSVKDTVAKIYNPKRYEKSSQKPTPIPSIDKDVKKLWENIKSIEANPGVDRFVTSELVNIVSLFNIHIGNGVMSEDNYEIRYSILNYLVSLIKEYASAVDKGDLVDSCSYISMILQHVDCIRTSIGQQFSSKGYVESHEASYQPIFASSLSRIVKAMSLIPEFLFQAISRSRPPRALVDEAAKEDSDLEIRSSLKEFNYPWKGFLILDLIEGYSILNEAELIVAPFKDIFKFQNWATLSHEVSHGYYSRIEFDYLEQKYIDGVWSRYVDEVATGKEQKYKSDLKESYFELFAHWFDFKHFYDGDYEFYIWSIWRTYIDIPRVYLFRTDYWFRSLFVKVCSKFHEFNEFALAMFDAYPNNIERKEKYLEYFEKEMKDLASFLSQKFPREYSSIELTDEEAARVSKQMILYYDLCRKFETEYFNEDVAFVVGSKYRDIDRDVDDIFSGRIIMRTIENPFALLKALLRKIYDGDAKLEEIDTAASAAFIFSLWQSARCYKR